MDKKLKEVFPGEPGEMVETLKLLLEDCGREGVTNFLENKVRERGRGGGEDGRPARARRR